MSDVIFRIPVLRLQNPCLLPAAKKVHALPIEFVLIFVLCSYGQVYKAIARTKRHGRKKKKTQRTLGAYIGPVCMHKANAILMSLPLSQHIWVQVIVFVPQTRSCRCVNQWIVRICHHYSSPHIIYIVIVWPAFNTPAMHRPQDPNTDFSTSTFLAK